MSDNKLDKVSPEVKALAEALKVAFKENIEDGVIIAPKTLWEESIAGAGVEGVTADTYRNSEKALSNLINASRLAAGEIGNELMRDDKSLARVGLSMPVGKSGKLDFEVLRSRTSRNPQDGSDITRMGATSTKFVQTFVGGKTGEGKLIGDHLSAQATEFFG